MNAIPAVVDTSFWAHAVAIHMIPYLFDYFDIRYTGTVREEILRPHPHMPTFEYPDTKYFKLLSEVGKLVQENPVQPIPDRYGRGEASAIQLALERNYMLLIDDDRPAVAARLLGISTVNTPACIVLMYVKRTISFAAAMTKLQQLEDLGTIAVSMVSDARRMIEYLK